MTVKQTAAFYVLFGKNAIWLDSDEQDAMMYIYDLYKDICLNREIIDKNPFLEFLVERTVTLARWFSTPVKEETSNGKRIQSLARRATLRIIRSDLIEITRLINDVKI